MDHKEKLLNRVPLKILSFLCRVPHTPHYGREIARATGVSIGSANQTLNLLFEMGVAAREKKGQLYLYRVVAENPLVREFKKFENVLDLNGLVVRIQKISNKIVLYGSCATGEDTSESDVDLFIISREKAKVLEEIRKEARVMPREIKAIIVSGEEYLLMRNKNEELLDDLNKGVVLWEKKV
jgi:predicted nucleotidyltransferase